MFFFFFNSYEPICEPSCSHGKCINTNLCNCTNTFFTGTYCNERFKYERIKWLDDTAKFFSTMFIFLTIMITAMTIIYRNNPLIKGGKRKKNFKYIVIKRT